MKKFLVNFLSIFSFCTGEEQEEAEPEWFIRGEPPPGWKEQYKLQVGARDTTLMVDKATDAWTISNEFRDGLRDYFLINPLYNKLLRKQGFVAEEFKIKATVLELGSYVGYTTRFLAEVFQKAIAFDLSYDFINLNRQLNADKDNIEYVLGDMDTYDFFTFNNKVDVVFLDAGHGEEDVFHNLLRVIHEIYPQYIVFDDYSAEAGVKKVVLDFLDRGLLGSPVEVGKKHFFLPPNREIWGSEGVICKVIMPEEHRRCADGSLLKEHEDGQCKSSMLSVMEGMAEVDEEQVIA